eukprot:SAG11_NODE_592_length_8310_cov_3.191868_2_plen_143_part_00
MRASEGAREPGGSRVNASAARRTASEEAVQAVAAAAGGLVVGETISSVVVHGGEQVRIRSRALHPGSRDACGDSRKRAVSMPHGAADRRRDHVQARDPRQRGSLLGAAQASPCAMLCQPVRRHAAAVTHLFAVPSGAMGSSA